MKRTWRLLAAIVVASLGLPAGVGAAVTLRLGHQNNPGHPIHEAAVHFAEQVAKKTNGEVQIKVFPSAQIGRMSELWTGVKIGTIEMAGSLVPALGADLVPGLTIFDAPYTFRDVEHFHKVSRGPIGQELTKQLTEKAGVRILYYQYFGTRHLTTSTKPIRKPEDLKGMKIRAVTIPILMATVEGMGATPTPIDFAEVYQSLRSGLVDGQENPVTSIYSMKFQDVQKYLMLTGHVFGIICTMVNEKVYQSLSPQARRAIEEAAVEAANLGDSLTVKQEGELVGELRKAGMTVIGPEQGLDVEAFRKRVQGQVFPKFEAKWTKARMDQVQSLGK
jgi:tripartite ATP-independent transporter DctP family solute receptor